MPTAAPVVAGVAASDSDADGFRPGPPDKPFRCQQCGRCYKHRHHLTSHAKNYCGRPPAEFRCANCPARYKYSHHLTAHVRHECGKDPQFQCPHCDYLSYRKSHVTRHCFQVHQLLRVRPLPDVEPDNAEN